MIDRSESELLQLDAANRARALARRRKHGAVLRQPAVAKVPRTPRRVATVAGSRNPMADLAAS